MSKYRASNLDFFKTRQQGQELKIFQKKGVIYFKAPLNISDFVTVAKINAPSVVAFFFQKKSIAYHINQLLNEEEILEVCDHFRLNCQKYEPPKTNFFQDFLLSQDIEKLKNRSPVVTIMGHVDHGKTTLLDYIMKSKIASYEFGGITQKTSAYQINTPQGKITFLDTPGHAAFSAMRARGAQVTDIVILVVAADEGVKPQTQEAFDHINAAQVPLIVFLNKIDKPAADVNRVTQELINIGIIPDHYGGSVPFVEGSALTGAGVDSLLEIINLQAEILELKADPNRLSAGNILECSLEKGKGAVMSLLVLSGTLKKRDFLIIGQNYARVRTLSSTQGREIDKVLPGTPCLVSGFEKCAAPGEIFLGVENDKEAKKFLLEQGPLETKKLVFEKPNSTLKQLKVILKTDNQGSAEALKTALEKLDNSEVEVQILRAAPGDISQADVLLAQASEAQIFSFNTKVSNEVRQLANDNKVTIVSAKIIYEVIEVVEKILKGMKTPVYEEVVTGEALILKIFYYSKVGNIAGCTMVDGFVESNSKVEVIRKGKIIYEGVIDSLKREVKDVSKVEKGFEFGTHIQKYNDISEGDILKFSKLVLKND